MHPPQPDLGRLPRHKSVVEAVHKRRTVRRIHNAFILASGKMPNPPFTEPDFSGHSHLIQQNFTIGGATTEVDRRSYRMQFLQAPPTSKAWRGFPIIGCLSVLRPIAFVRRTEPPSVGTRVRRSSTTSATSRSAASIERRHGSGDPRVGKLSICTQTRRSLLIANSP